MKKEKHYWKVVRTGNPKGEDCVYTSAIITEGVYLTIYKIDEYVSAPLKENGLFVFKTRSAARKFKKRECGWKHLLFKVKVRGEQITHVQPYDTGDMLVYNRLVNFNEYNFPEGTCNFPEVMLVEQSH